MLTTRYQKVQTLTVTDVMRMHALFEAHYASSPLATFLDDLSRKEGVFVVRRRSDAEIVGFSTLGVYRFEIGGRQVKGMFQRRFEALDQSRHALAAASCLSALGDADLPRVWDHAERHKMLKPPLTAAALKAKPAAQARDVYITALATPDESDKDWTDNLGRHKDFVCALAGR